MTWCDRIKTVAGASQGLPPPLCHTTCAWWFLSSILDRHSYLPAWMVFSTMTTISMCSYFQGPPRLSPVALLSTGHYGHYISKTCFGNECPKVPSSCTPYALSQRPVQRLGLSLECPRGVEGIEHSYNFQEAFNQKRMYQNVLETPTDRKIETIYFLQGPLSRLRSQGCHSLGPEKSPKVRFLPCWIHMDGPHWDLKLPCCMLCLVFYV